MPFRQKRVAFSQRDITFCVKMLVAGQQFENCGFPHFFSVQIDGGNASDVF